MRLFWHQNFRRILLFGMLGWRHCICLGNVCVRDSSVQGSERFYRLDAELIMSLLAAQEQQRKEEEDRKRREQEAAEAAAAAEAEQRRAAVEAEAEAQRAAAEQRDAEERAAIEEQKSKELAQIQVPASALLLRLPQLRLPRCCQLQTSALLGSDICRQYYVYVTG